MKFTIAQIENADSKLTIVEISHEQLELLEILIDDDGSKSVVVHVELFLYGARRIKHVTASSVGRLREHYIAGPCDFRYLNGRVGLCNVICSIRLSESRRTRLVAVEISAVWWIGR